MLIWERVLTLFPVGISYIYILLVYYDLMLHSQINPKSISIIDLTLRSKNSLQWFKVSVHVIALTIGLLTRFNS